MLLYVCPGDESYRWSVVLLLIRSTGKWETDWQQESTRILLYSLSMVTNVGFDHGKKCLANHEKWSFAERMQIVYFASQDRFLQQA